MLSQTRNIALKVADATGLLSNIILVSTCRTECPTQILFMLQIIFENLLSFKIVCAYKTLQFKMTIFPIYSNPIVTKLVKVISIARGPE